MRMIDADAMMRVYQEVLCNHVSCIECSFFMDDKYCRFEAMLSEAPAVDAVPVVRCRECKHLGFCGDATNLEVMGFYGYCSRGERKEGADNG